MNAAVISSDIWVILYIAKCGVPCNLHTDSKRSFSLIIRKLQ